MKYGVRNCKLKQTWPGRERADWHSNAQPSSRLPGSDQSNIRWGRRGLLGRGEERGVHQGVRVLELELELELELVTSWNYFPGCCHCSLATGWRLIITSCQVPVNSQSHLPLSSHLLSAFMKCLLCFTTKLVIWYLIFIPICARFIWLKFLLKVSTISRDVFNQDK